MTATKADATSTPAWQRGSVAAWLVTTSHRRLGAMYVGAAGAFLVLGGILAILIRTQLLRPDLSVVTGNAFDGMVTMHGATMVFFVVTPVVVGLAVAIAPAMIGSRTTAFPRANTAAFWLFLFAGLTFALSGLASGGAARAGWTAYPPLSLLQPKNGQDFFLIALVLLAVSLFLTAANLAVTIATRRTHGMTWANTPIFVRSVHVYAILLLALAPLWCAGLVLLLLERARPGDFDVFVSGEGEGATLRGGAVWLFGQPVAYLALIPALGIVAEILAVFSRRAFPAARVFVSSLAALGGLLILVWLHHTYSVGTGEKPGLFLLVLALLVIAPAAVALWSLGGVLQGVFAAQEGQAPVLFALGAVILFALGGLSAVFLAIWGNDRDLRGTAFAVGHAHYILFGPALFALAGGLVYWWPKLFGRLLDPKPTQAAAGLLLIGFSLTFFMHFLIGDEGMARRTDTYGDGGALAAYQLVASIGAYVAAVGLLILVVTALRSVNGRRAGNDPWRADTLEWLAASPLPPHTFDTVPPVASPRPLRDLRQRLEDKRAS